MKCGNGGVAATWFSECARMRAQPAGPAESSALHDFARSGPTKDAHRRALDWPDGLLRSEAGRGCACGAMVQPKGMTACRCCAVNNAKIPLTWGFGARGGIRSLDLPITRRQQTERAASTG